MVQAGDPIKATDYAVIQQSSTLKPLVRLVQTATTSIGAGASVALAFGSGSEDIDTNGWHDTVTNNTRITPTIAGYYRCDGVIYFASTTAILDACIAKNGVQIGSGAREAAVGTPTARGMLTNCILTANGTTDYFEIVGTMAAAGTTNLSARFTSSFEVEFLRPL